MRTFVLRARAAPTDSALRRLVLVVASLASLLAPFGGSATNIALPTIGKEFSAGRFVLGGAGAVPPPPAGARGWVSALEAAGARRGSSDRFVLRFVKPAK